MKWLAFIIMCASCYCLSGQQTNKGPLMVGGYVSFMIDPVVLSETQDSANLTSYFLNVNARYALSRKFVAGAEFILAFTTPDNVNDPFYLTGVTLDYNFLRFERSKFNFRIGLSYGNLSYAGEGEPQRRQVINRVLGGSYDFRISDAIWIYAGLYHHLPMNNIPDKYAVAQPFLGAYVELPW